MIENIAQPLLVLESIVFLSVVALHFIKKNIALVFVYCVQSFCIVLLIAIAGFAKGAQGLLLAAFLTFIIKIILAPILFTRAIKDYDERIAKESYLNTPLALLVLTALFLLAQSNIGTTLTSLSPIFESLIRLAIAGIFISLFLIINHKGILHQIVGVLGIENNIVALGLFLGIEHTLALELGITFDILLWIVGASLCISLIRQHFTSLDTSALQDLRE